jgi:hypothetical protein
MVKVKIPQAYIKCVTTHKKRDTNLTFSLRAKDDIRHNIIATNRTYLDLSTKTLYGHRNWVNSRKWWVKMTIWHGIRRTWWSLGHTFHPGINLSDFHKSFESLSRKPAIFAIIIKSPPPHFEGQSKSSDSVQFYIKIPYNVPAKCELELVFFN